MVGPLALFKTPWMRYRDWRRRRRVDQLIASGALEASEDYFHAAMVLQHSPHLDDYRRAHELARQAVELGHRPARWLVAAAFDRWLMRQGKPQKYGTQYTMVGSRWQIWRIGREYRLWDVDPSTTDEERAEWGVPPLQIALEHASQLGTVMQNAMQLRNPVLARLEVPGFALEVQDLRYARVLRPTSERPRPQSLPPEDARESPDLPPEYALCRVGDHRGARGPDGQLGAMWRTWSAMASEPFEYGWMDSRAPALEALDLDGQPAIWLSGEDDESSHIFWRVDPSTYWQVWGWLSRDEMIRLAASLGGAKGWAPRRQRLILRRATSAMAASATPVNISTASTGSCLRPRSSRAR